MLYAHSGNDAGAWHALADHLSAVADLAAGFASWFGQAEVARWLGWWHDVGKASPAFQAYLRDPRPARRTDHSSAGMVQVAAVCLPLAMVPACHHGGLVDGKAFYDRLKLARRDPALKAALSQAVRDLCGGRDATDLTAVTALLSANDPSQSFRAAMLIRMLHSAVVDADCLDTERHFSPDQAGLRGGSPSMAELWDHLSADQQRLSAGAAPTLVNQCRAEVYDACLATAELPPGFFRLTVPTGGGKTRSAMAFALRHALRHGLRRVIVALPYTSIIEQTCDVYRGIYGREAVLEHHSAVTEQPEISEDDERRARLAADNWDVPLVVTTNVQLFESLFAAQNSRLRKLHNIAGAVLILDEVQTLPLGLLRPTLSVLRLLVEDYGCTVVLSSATQPASGQRDDLADGIADAREIVVDHARHFRQLARVSYEFPASTDSTLSWAQVAETACAEPQALVILNTIADAGAVFDLMPPDGRYHLSARMCGAHRRAVLAEVRRRLAAGEPCRLISTQVVEAGVDLDFPLVMRALAGLDRLAQAAGRCNREGRRETGRVVVFRPAEGGSPRGSYQTATDTASEMLAEGPLDLHDPDLFERYFRRPMSRNELDSKEIVDRVSQWRYRQASDEYRFIDELSCSAIVSYRPDQPRIDDLVAQLRHSATACGGLWRAVQPYLVSMRPQLLTSAEQLAEGLWLWRGRYDDERGVVLDGWQPGALVV